jgi:glycosyltransferase involved in cell wall biosynthesis
VKAPRVGLILPAFDERQALPLVLDALPRERIDRLVVVDNGSRDGTGEVALRAGAEVVHEPRRGYGSACMAGIARLTEPGPDGQARLDGQDVVAFLDADFSDYPEELPAVVDPVLQGCADFVLGSRILGGADMRALLPQAWFGNRLACSLMRVLFGARYTDLGPFRALRLESLRGLDMRDADFGWTVEMQLKAHAQGLRILEVPVRYRRRVGRSKITGTVGGTLRAAWKILGWILVWRLRLSPYSWLKPQVPETRA